MVPPLDELLSEEQRSAQKERLDRIRQTIRDGNAALALGAGVSLQSGMPGWAALISRMLGHGFKNYYASKAPAEYMRLCDRLTAGSPEILSQVGALEAAEYVALLFRSRLGSGGDEAAIRSIVREFIRRTKAPWELLCENWAPGRKWKEGFAPACPTPADWEAYFSRVSEEEGKGIPAAGTIFAVSHLIHRGIRRVMTYNYDPLVQEHLQDLYGISAYTHPG